MLYVKPNSKVIHPHHGIVNAPTAKFPERFLSSPKSPKFNELRARQENLQNAEANLRSSGLKKPK